MDFSQYRWITKDIILRLAGKFRLRSSPEGSANPMLLHGVVSPVTDVDELLRVIKISDSGSKSAAVTGAVTTHTVPTGKRWRVNFVDPQVLTGTITINGVAVYNADATPVGMRVASGGGRGQVTYGMTLPEGWTIRIDVTVSVAGSIQALALIEEEDAY